MLLSGLSLTLPLPALAQGLELEMPGHAELALQETELPGNYSLPVSPWLRTGTDMLQAQGVVTRVVWQLPGFGATTEQLMRFLRTQLEQEGYEAVFACDATLCGGFDFRFAMDVAPEPAMHVDLGDFSYLTASLEGPEGPDSVSLLVSRGGDRGYVHLVRISAADLPPIEVSVSAKLPDSVDPADLVASLESVGTATLSDLSFDIGASSLSDIDYPSLITLAAYLQDHPETTVVLVGHTDAEGTLDNNIALSRARASAVRQHLIDVFGIPASQLGAEGVGYLAPRASNASQEGRDQNRRVEVIVTSTR